MENKINKLSKKERKEKKRQEGLQKQEIIRIKGIESEKRKKIKKKEKCKQEHITKLNKLLKNLKLYGALWMIIALIFAIFSYGISSNIEYRFEDVDSTFYVSDNASLLSDQLKREIIDTNLSY
ncbi:MAG: hypothetical protein N4A48_12065 [Tepidibacter sp.]|uniref:hypothetical protein n=1 Tax=Tepidibacter sp. TaxID=2529387 RepID=UPI0025E91AB1|nr:hypothetical protein [Tepidibacter sp.]MCT4509466.1 hypothetical protein [Tepidibacter sp.]